MLPRSSSLVPLLLLQDKGQQRKQQRWHHPEQSSSHSSASASDNEVHDHTADATNGFWTESDASSTRSHPDADREGSDAEEDSSEQEDDDDNEEEEEEEEETLPGPNDSKLDPGSGFDSESESDGSDTSQTLDDPIASDIRPRPTVPLHTLREESVQRLANAWLDIFTRYGKETSELPPDDEIDLRTGELIVDNGVLASQSRTLFGTLTKLGQELKGPLEEEQRNMRRRMRKAAQRAETQLRNQRANEDKAAWMKKASGIRKSRGRHSVTKEEPTYGGDDFDNLLYIPTSAAASTSAQDLSQPQQLEKQRRDTGDRSHHARTRTSHLLDEHEHEHNGDEEREDEEHEDEEEPEQVEEGTEETEDGIEDRNSSTPDYFVVDSALVQDQATDPEDARKSGWEASEDEHSYFGEDLDNHLDQHHRQEQSLEDERLPDDESRLTLRKPVASDTQPFSVHSSMSTFKSTWDDAGISSSSLTWTTKPIYRPYSQRRSDNEDNVDGDDEEEETTNDTKSKGVGEFPHDKRRFLQ
ncbi:hypothetical protein BGZ72_005339 [Mortierella alpina]|nr:hypothetical protein BGZ72_005339 [Mortierella alpina]